eukprot:850562-Lingulodinium_polyedra.AAC.1
MLRCAGASRARTFRTRVRTWKRVRDYLMAMYGIAWPGTAMQIVDYLESRAEEPCGRTVPHSVLSALSFLEERGEVPVESRFSRALFVIHTVDDLAAALSQGAPPTKKSPGLPVALIVAMECFVTDVTQKRFLWAFCWVKFVK